MVIDTDAHGKNFSLRYRAGAVSLAPFYDVLSTVDYPDLSAKLAMKIAKRATLDEIDSETWRAFAEDIGLAGSFVRRRVEELAEAVVGQTPSIPESLALAGLDVAALRQYSSLIVSRAERVARTGVAPAASSRVADATNGPTTKAGSRTKGGPR